MIRSSLAVHSIQRHTSRNSGWKYIPRNTFIFVSQNIHGVILLSEVGSVEVIYRTREESTVERDALSDLGGVDEASCRLLDVAIVINSVLELVVVYGVEVVSICLLKGSVERNKGAILAGC